MQQKVKLKDYTAIYYYYFFLQLSHIQKSKEYDKKRIHSTIQY